jgi:hypothetical protein
MNERGVGLVVARVLVLATCGVQTPTPTLRTRTA